MLRTSTWQIKGVFSVQLSIPALILFGCAAVMASMGARRYRAGQKGRALFNLFMAAAMVIFGAGYL